jgi:mono/diheme cytochrome c family protein
MRLTYLIFFLAANLLMGANKARVNPYGGQPLEIQAGSKLYQRYCAGCHEAGEKAPPLSPGAVRGMSSSELFRLLKDGRLAQGLPSWADLPPEQRWQIIAWLKSSD